MKPVLGLFLELGGSLEEWDAVGFFSREITLYNSLARKQFSQIYIFTYGSKQDLNYSDRLEPNITIIPRGVRSANYLNNFFYELWFPIRNRSILRRCDILKTNQNSGSIAAAIAKLLYQKKLVVRSGYIGSELARRSKLSMLVRAYYFLAENLSYRICDLALISGEPNRKILSQQYPFLKGKLFTHNNFIDTSLFRKDAVSKKEFDIIYVARFNRDKNHQLILSALENTEISVLFVGQGETLPLMRSEARRMGVRATFRNSVPNENLPSCYNSARICAFPSLHEGSPKSLLEAMACELAVVTLTVPGIINIISHEKNGLIGSETDFKTSIQKLLNNPVLRDTLGQSARKTIIEDYSFERILEEEIRLYQNL